jgi:MFS family permease
MSCWLVAGSPTSKELPFSHDGDQRRFPIRRSDLAALQAPFWWAIVIASLLSLARFSPAFLVLKAHDISIGAAYVPMMLVVMYLVYSVTAYPFGVLADHFDRRVQLGIGTVILIGADVVLAAAGDIWLTALGAALWGLQLGVTHGLLGAAVADAAPDCLRGAAFGIYDVAIGVATFAASAGAGVLWMASGAAAAFGIGACIAAAADLMLLLWPLPKAANTRTFRRPAYPCAPIIGGHPKISGPIDFQE